MSYNPTYSRVIYTATGAQTIFPFLFKIFFDTDIVVYNIPPGGSPEIIINGTFDTDTDWNKGTGWTIGGDTANCDGTQTATTELSPTLANCESGKKYLVEFDITSNSAGAIRLLSGATQENWATGVGRYSYEHIADGARLKLKADDVFVGSIDNFTAREVREANEPYSPLILNTDYTVEIYGDDGGQVTLLEGAEDGAQITLFRELEINRFFDYQTSGDLLANTLDADQDYQTYLLGDLRESLDTAVLGGIGYPAYVKLSGDNMTGDLNVPGGGTGTAVLQEQEITTLIDAIDTGLKLDDDGKAIIKTDGSWINNQLTAAVLFDGRQTPPTVLASYNVQSVVKETGYWTVTWEEPMDTVNYEVIGNSDFSECFVSVDALNTTSCHVFNRWFDGTITDDIIGIIVAGGKD